MLEITAYTDGSCLGNPGVGGYAAKMIAVVDGVRKDRICLGYEKKDTTNNRMELSAVLEVLKWLNKIQKQPCKIKFYTDSQYIVDCMKHSASELTCQARTNRDLFAQIIQEGMKGEHEYDFVKIKGHGDDRTNREVDKLARAQAVKARHERYGV